MKNIVIKANNLGKEYILRPNNSYKTLRDSISDIPKRIFNLSKKQQKESFWALRNASFELEKGDALGIIGPNGAGKSTLLKILARITTPTEGQAEITGKVATMLEVGTGFNPELTGRENIYLNGAIIGMKKNEINKKFDKIVEFSEIQRFIDIPVKKYSSGMQVRLAFSVAAHLDPEILLLDEVLAVGDLAFQKKSLLKMRDIVKDQGRTVLFVSHNMAAVQSLCNKTLLFNNGKIKEFGKTEAVISKYIKGVYKDTKVSLSDKKRSGNGEIKITDFWIENPIGQRTKSPKSGGKYKFIFQYECHRGTTKGIVDIGFFAQTIPGESLFSHFASYTGQTAKLNKSKGQFIFSFDKFPLTEGRYKLTIHTTIDGCEADFVPDAAEFSVQDGMFFNSKVTINQKISPLLVDGDWKYE